MNKKISNFIILLSIISIIISCQNEDSIPVDISNIGKISVNREVVGVNQNVEFSCPLNIAPNTSELEILLEDNYGIHHEYTRYKEGIAYFNISFSEAGEHTIKIKAKYIYAQKEAKEIESVITIVVHPMDFNNSFFGDSYEMVVKDNPNGKRESENLYTLIGENNYLHYFDFVRGKLSQGRTGQIKKNTTNISPKYSYNIFGMAFRAQSRAHSQFSPTEIHKVARRAPIVPDFIPSAEQKRVIDEFEKGTLLSDEDRIILGKMVDDKIIILTGSLTWKNFKNETRTITVKSWVTDKANECALLIIFAQ